MKPEFIICGLGNPGEKYAQTRHNAGFCALDMLSQKLNVKINASKFHSLCQKAEIEGVTALLIKPQTFMNESGLAVKEAADFFKIAPEKIIVIHDDINFEPGKMRIRLKGSDGGHNGLKSVISCLSSSGFIRIKLGVGKKPPEYDLADWVLSPLDKNGREALDGALENACDALSLILSGKADRAMERYN